MNHQPIKTRHYSAFDSGARAVHPDFQPESIREQAFLFMAFGGKVTQCPPYDSPEYAAYCRSKSNTAQEWKEGEGGVMQADEKQRTAQQQKSLEVFCRQTAMLLNKEGRFIEAIFNGRVIKIRWSQYLVKDEIWRPIQLALTEKQSSADMTTTECQEVYLQVCAGLSGMLGIVPPEWPNRYSGMELAA